MVKCMVQSCRNHTDARQPRKRFFSFPSDKARVKVWLAALRETEREIPEQSRICEDHFLCHHITRSGISSDAIPITPHLGSADSTSGVFADGVDDEEFSFDDYEEEDEEDHLLANVGLKEVQREYPATLSNGNKNINNDKQPTDTSTKPAPVKNRSNVALGPLTKRFMQLLLSAPDGILDLNEATEKLGTRKRRVYDITSVLNGIQLIKKMSKNKIQWLSSAPVSGSGSHQPVDDLYKLKSTEEALDWLIKDCAQQLFALTDLKENADFAYVTYEDICQIGVFKDQTIISVRAPEETKLEVPTPTESSIQIHLKGCRGPINILTCDTEGQSKDSKLVKPGCFVSLEESRIHTKPLISDVSSSAAAVQSA